MRKCTLHAAYAQQLTFVRDYKQQDNLASWCSGSIYLMRQRAAFHELPRTRLIKLGIRAADSSRVLLLSH